MTSQGGAVRLSAAGRVGGRRSCCPRPRTGPSHCAHVFAAAVCRVWWAPKVNGRSPTGSTARGYRRLGLRGGGPRRFGFVALFRTGLSRVVGRRLLLVVAGCPGSLAASAP